MIRWSNNDRLGRFKLLEFKENQHYLDKAQRLTFGLIDKMLKSSDESYRYEGFYLINIVDNKNNSVILINNTSVSIDYFRAFLLDKVEPYRFWVRILSIIHYKI